MIAEIAYPAKLILYKRLPSLFPNIFEKIAGKIAKCPPIRIYANITTNVCTCGSGLSPSNSEVIIRII